MKGLFGWIGMSVGGAVGWWLGAYVGFMTAFFVSLLGTGIGLYAGRKLAQHLLGG
jgi:hypothetical protein